MSQRKQFLIVILIISTVLLGLAVHFLFFLERYVDAPAASDLDSAYRLNARIIRFRTFDSIIAGSSMSQNFKCTEFDRITHGHSYKLTVPGSQIPRTCKIIEFACSKHRIRAVLLDMHLQLLMAAPPEKSSDEDRYYSSDTLLGDLCDGVSLWSLKDRRKYYMERLSDKKHAPATWSRDDIYCWANRVPCGKKYLAREILTGQYKFNSMPTGPAFLEQNIHRHLLPLFRRHPEVTFFLFLPPFSPFMYIGRDELKLARKAVMDDFLSLPNVRLYDFQGLPEICLNYDNYKDISHYSQQINSWILEQIEADNFRVTPQNRHLFEKRFSDMMRSFDAEKEIEQMKQYAREHPVSQ